MFCLCSALMKVIDSDQENWEDKLESVLFCYRSSKNDSTKYSPFYLMYGREPKLPIELKFQNENGEDGASEEFTLEEKVQQLLDVREKVRNLALQNIEKAQERQKRNYDKKHDSTKVINTL